MATDTTNTEYLLTTVDNPYDPFTQFDAWFAWDHSAGYNTPALLARVVVSSDNLSEADQAHAIELGIDEIVRENVSGVHKKISKSVT